MSRTFRRKNYEDTQGTSWDRQGRKTNGYYTEYERSLVRRETDEGYYWIWTEYTYRPMTKDEIKWRYLHDHGETNSHWARNNPGPWVRQLCQKVQRQQARRELHKYRNNPDYEPIIESRRNKEWWYWL